MLIFPVANVEAKNSKINFIHSFKVFFIFVSPHKSLNK